MLLNFAVCKLSLTTVKYRPIGTPQLAKIYNDASSVIIPFKDGCHDAIPYAMK